MTIVSVRGESVPANLPRSARGPSWQQALKDAFRDPRELCQFLRLDAKWAEEAVRATGGFPLFVPRSYAARMRPGDPDDPLLRQVLPIGAELAIEPGDSTDPVGDLAATLAPGLIQKYEQRVLMVATGVCAVHCRYCFRRHFPYEDAPHSLNAWEAAIDQIAVDRSLREVILSGGDPLTLVDSQLRDLANRLAAIPHLTRLRVHTRVPVMIPERVTDELIGWLRGTRLTPIVVIHANHAAELDEHVGAALARLADAGIMLLNQAVLLRGVNDSAAAQIELCERLIDLRVIPYYLHQLDRVRGAAHFEVPIATGREIIATVRAALPGYAVPRYVQEIAGEKNKVVLA